MLAKLAKLAHSAGRSVQDVAEEHEWLLADELSHRERLAALIGESQVGERLIEEILGAELAAHEGRIMCADPRASNARPGMNANASASAERRVSRARNGPRVLDPLSARL